MERILLFFGVTTIIIYGIATVISVWSKKNSLFKGWLALATISLAMFMQTLILKDGTTVTSVMASPYGTNPVQYEAMKYAVGITSFLLLTILLYCVTYVVTRFMFKLFLNGRYVGNSSVIDYFIAPIVFLVINYYVSFDYIVR